MQWWPKIMSWCLRPLFKHKDFVCPVLVLVLFGIDVISDTFWVVDFWVFKMAALHFVMAMTHSKANDRERVRQDELKSSMLLLATVFLNTNYIFNNTFIKFIKNIKSKSNHKRIHNRTALRPPFAFWSFKGVRDHSTYTVHAKQVHYCKFTESRPRTMTVVVIKVMINNILIPDISCQFYAFLCIFCTCE